MELEEAASWLMCFRLNCFDIKSLSLKSPGTLSSTNVLLGFKWEQKHIFGSYFSFKSLLVNQDKKKKKQNPECTEKKQNMEKQFPKNIQIKDVQTEFDGFFSPSL